MAIYAILWLLTFWSFLRATWSDPGFVPYHLTDYQMVYLSPREQILWQIFERLSESAMDDVFVDTARQF